MLQPLFFRLSESGRIPKDCLFNMIVKKWGYVNLFCKIYKIFWTFWQSLRVLYRTWLFYLFNNALYGIYVYAKHLEKIS